MNPCKHRWFRFSLRQMFFAVAVPSLGMSLIASELARIHHRQLIKADYESAGGATYEGERTLPPHYTRGRFLNCLAEMLGDRRVQVIVLPSSISDEDCTRIKDAYPESHVWHGKP